MCYQTKCTKCGKTTWAGCGAHKDSALNGVPEKDRCAGWKTGKCTGAAAQTTTNNGTATTNQK